MANLETNALENKLASRRAMLLGGGAAALAAMALTRPSNAAVTVSTYTDIDILNFALNLEYLEANFYYMAAFGCTIDAPNAAATNAGAPSGGIGIGSGTTTTGTPATVTGATMVPFTLPAVKAYAIETAIEEGKHVLALRAAIQGASGTNVAQPAINITPTTFNSLAMAAGVTTAALLTSGNFNPYANDYAFLAGAYIFEDVGVTAYGGAAPLITSRSVLQSAASILAVEAYHAGLIRSTIYNADPTNSLQVLSATQAVANFRSKAAHAVAPSGVTYPAAGAAYSDDFGLYPGTYPQDTSTSSPGVTANPPVTGTVSLAGGTGVAASNIADAEPTYVIGYGRTTTQVLNIVTAGGAATTNTKATGGFYPSGLNGTFM